MLIIGLTGGIGSGKSAASAVFEELGIHVVDADIVARQVVEPGTIGLSKIAEHFGLNVLNSDSTLNRAALRQIVFSDTDARHWLESLLHPLIREETISQLKQGSSPYTILVSPLLFETDQHQLVDRTLLIDVPECLQIKRASSRDNNSEQQIQAIIDQQMSRDCKRKKADDIIENDSDLDALRLKVKDQHLQYLDFISEVESGNSLKHDQRT